MIRVLLVDDELLVRIGLRHMIPWQEHGYEIAGEADNGNMALELFIELRPDVVFTDVRMPGMDGLTLTQKIKQISPGTPVCILSCHTDFSLVQKGIHSGIFDYIDKLNLTSKEIIRCLQSLKEHVQTGAPSGETHNTPYLPAAYPDKLKKLNVEMSSLSWLQNYNSDDLPDGPWQWLIGEIDDAAHEIETIYPEAVRQGRIFLDSTQRIHLILAIDSECPERLNEWLNRHIRCTFAASLPVETVGDWMHAYQQADEALTDLFYSEWNRLLQYKDKLSYRSQLNVWSREQEDMMLQYVRTGQSSLLSAILTEVLDQAYGAFIHPKRIKQSITMLLFRMLNEIKWDDDQKQFWSDRIEMIRAIKTKHDLSEWLQFVMDEMIRFVPSSRFSAEVKAVVAFMEERFAKRITLLQLAQHVHLNPNYLVRIFKEQTGKPPMSYLTDLRIEKAKKMLSSDILPVQQVAESVGFINLSHFSRLFKKMTGRAPTEFRGSSENEQKKVKIRQTYFQENVFRNNNG